MKKIYSFLAACVLASSTLTAMAEKVVTAMTNRGTQVTSLSQLSEGATVLFRAVSRDGYLFETSNKVWLSKGVPSSGTSSSYLFKISSFTNNGSDASLTITTPAGYNMPNLVRSDSPTINGESVAATFTLTQANTQNPELGDSIWYIQDENGLYFNGNGLAYNSTIWGLFGYFAGWNAAGGNSQYQIFLPETENSTLYDVTVDGVNQQGDALYDTKTYQVGLGDSIVMPSVAGYHLNMDESTAGSDPLVLTANNYYKVTGDAGINLVYELNDLLFTPINGTDTTWYFLKIRQNSYCYYNAETNAATADGAVPTIGTTDNKAPEAYLWAFAGDRENGFRIINKKAGNSLVLTAAGQANGDANYLSDAAGDAAMNTYMYNEPVNGQFTFQLKDVENAYINQFGGANGKLRFWVDGGAKTDGGSLFKVVKYDADSVNRVLRTTVLNKYQEVLNATGAVGGYTPADAADLKAAVEALRAALKTDAKADTTAAQQAYEAILTKTKIAFDPSKSYVIKSAFDRSMHQDSTFGLFFREGVAENDSVGRLQWGAIPAGVETETGDAAFKFKFVNSGENASESGTPDSIFYYVQNETVNGVYTMGGYRWAGKAPMLSAQDVTNAENAGDTKIYNAKTILSAGAYFGTFALQHLYKEGENWDKVTVSTNAGNGNAKATSGTLTTYNIVSKTIDTSWYLVPVKDTPVGISAVEAKKAVEAGTIFDLTGRKVTKAEKGVYIINGKKVVVK